VQLLGGSGKISSLTNTPLNLLDSPPDELPLEVSDDALLRALIDR